MQISTPHGPISLTEATADLLHLDFPEGATGTVWVTVDGAGFPPIDLASVSLAGGRVLVAVEGHSERSVGLSWSA